MAENLEPLFSDETVKNVRQSWSLISADLQYIGISIFFNLFEKHPEYQSMFKGFSNVPREDLKKSPAFARHALNVANSVNSLVFNLDNKQMLASQLVEIGTSHKKRNVTPQQFQNLQSILLDTVKTALGDKCTDAIFKSWSEVLTVAVSTAVDALSK